MAPVLAATGFTDFIGVNMMSYAATPHAYSACGAGYGSRPAAVDAVSGALVDAASTSDMMLTGVPLVATTIRPRGHRGPFRFFVTDTAIAPSLLEYKPADLR